MLYLSFSKFNLVKTVIYAIQSFEHFVVLNKLISTKNRVFMVGPMLDQVNLEKLSWFTSG